MLRSFTVQGFRAERFELRQLLLDADKEWRDNPNLAQELEDFMSKHRLTSEDLNKPFDNLFGGKR